MHPIIKEEEKIQIEPTSPPTPINEPPLTDDATVELPQDYEKTVPIFNSIFEIFCFMVLTETSKPLYFSVLPFVLILILKYVFKRVGADTLHWKYCGSILFLVYEYLVGNSVYALLRDFVVLFLSVVSVVLIEERLISKWI